MIRLVMGALRIRRLVRNARLAGVEPTFTGINGTDPVAYILSANVKRRNLNTGQRAMAAAQMRGFSKNENRIIAAAEMRRFSLNESSQPVTAKSIKVSRSPRRR